MRERFEAISRTRLANIALRTDEGGRKLLATFVAMAGMEAREARTGVVCWRRGGRDGEVEDWGCSRPANEGGMRTLDGANAATWHRGKMAKRHKA